MSDCIRIEKLCKSYGGFTLKDIDMTIPTGCVVGIIGNNGAGKTTLLKCISGAVLKDSGTVEMPGNDHVGYIGMVFDKPHLPSRLTVSEVGRVMSNLMPMWDGRMFDDLISRYGMDPEKKVSDLSRGMGMKLQTAVAISQRPEVILMDEPTAGLDPAARDEFLDDVMEFIQDESHTVLISSHITSDLERIADYIAFIHDGRLEMFDEKDAILGRYGILKCGTEEELRSIGDGNIVSVRTGRYGSEALIDDKDGIREAYPEVTVDDATLDEIFVFMVRGDRR